MIFPLLSKSVELQVEHTACVKHIACTMCILNERSRRAEH